METKVFERWLMPKDIKPSWSEQVEVLKEETRKTKENEDWPVLLVRFDDKTEAYVSGWALRAANRKQTKVSPGDFLELRKGTESSFIFIKLEKITEENV